MTNFATKSWFFSCWTRINLKLIKIYENIIRIEKFWFQKIDSWAKINNFTKILFDYPATNNTEPTLKVSDAFFNENLRSRLVS